MKKIRKLTDNMRGIITAAADKKYKQFIHLSEYENKDIYSIAFTLGYEDCWLIYSDDDMLTDRARDRACKLGKRIFNRNFEKLSIIDKAHDIFVQGYLHGFHLCWSAFEDESEEVLEAYKDVEAIEMGEEQKKRLSNMWENIKKRSQA